MWYTFYLAYTQFKKRNNSHFVTFQKERVTFHTPDFIGNSYLCIVKPNVKNVKYELSFTQKSAAACCSRITC